ncbi:hypothetical protein [Pluralibacter sp.]|uniref:hypothetical protein n=1 Tax=Pluralibacter sp. TaxID=1920032 RepID=UPI0025E68C6A|nr:hypothetical protein [Pluralibacter sp.]MBV8043562.1 hypothetical protein [Pluralibacter sp.]
MATFPTFPFSGSHGNFVRQIITRPLPASADLFEVADLCTSFVNVLLETSDTAERNALCGRLLHALMTMQDLCESDLPEHLIERLSTDVIPASIMPDCWYNFQQSVSRFHPQAIGALE